jgi:hypothetical protein
VQLRAGTVTALELSINHVRYPLQLPTRRSADRHDRNAADDLLKDGSDGRVMLRVQIEEVYAEPTFRPASRTSFRLTSTYALFLGCDEPELVVDQLR